MRLNLIVSVVLLAVLTSCGGNKSGQATEEVPADSALNDSLRNDSLMAEDYPMPKAADELFDDFVYNFVVNHKLQMDRNCPRRTGSRSISSCARAIIRCSSTTRSTWRL